MQGYGFELKTRMVTERVYEEHTPMHQAQRGTSKNRNTGAEGWKVAEGSFLGKKGGWRGRGGLKNCEIFKCLENSLMGV